MTSRQSAAAWSRKRGSVVGAAASTPIGFDPVASAMAMTPAMVLSVLVAIDHARSRKELARSNAALQQALRLDEQLTAVVLEGGDLDAILARVGSLVPGELTWIPDGEPVASPVIADVVAEVGDGGDGPSVERDGLVAQPVLAAKRLLGVLVAATTDAGRDTTHLVLERAAPILALTIAEARQVARASQLGGDIATIDLVSRRESDPRVDPERMRGAEFDPRRTYDVIVVDDPAAVPPLRQRLPHVREATAAAYRDQAVLLVRHRTDWATAWPADGPTAGFAGPVSGRLTFRDAYLDPACTAEPSWRWAERPGSPGPTISVRSASCSATRARAS